MASFKYILTKMQDYKFTNKLSAKGKFWDVQTPSYQYVNDISSRFQLSTMVSTLLFNRYIAEDDVENFIAPKLKNLLPDPYCLKDMKPAVDRIFSAITSNQQITIYGDYDVDGATASATLMRYFKKLGIDVSVYIPDRLKEGYGLNSNALLNLKEQGADLIITVDCGVVSFEPIADARNAGLDVIVIDHHLSAEIMPVANAVINPNRVDDTSGLNNLCAAGVVFMFMVAFNQYLRKQNYFSEKKISEPNLIEFLDLTALGTVCDVMELRGLNRAFVAQGLKVLTTRRNLGISSIMDIANVNTEPDVYTLGFIIGPRINAAGRIDDCSLGAKILSSNDEVFTHQTAKKLDDLNKTRKDVEAQILAEAEILAAQFPENSSALIIAKEGWHPGVIGIVASRIKDKYNKPTAIIALSGGVGKASARSVDGVDIGSAITNARAKGLLLAGGGHKAAAGFTIEESKLPEFTKFVEEFLSSSFAKYQLKNVSFADFMLNPSAVNYQTASEFSILEPFGNGNSEPFFAVENIRAHKIKIYSEKHISFFASSDDFLKTGSHSFKAIAFNANNTPLGEDLLNSQGKSFSIFGKIKKNEYNGARSVDFVIEDAVF